MHINLTGKWILHGTKDGIKYGFSNNTGQEQTIDTPVELV